jgi:isopentenyl-diphosphate delta-isomerase
LWTNTCCSHPQPGEVLADAAQRRLREEMGFGTPLKEIFEFVYEAEFDNGLSEHEFDHVFAGVYDGKIEYNKDEVMDYCYRSVEEVTTELEQKPEQFSAWFRVAFPRIKEWQRDLKVKR